jgi:hypothetical protein
MKFDIVNVVTNMEEKESIMYVVLLAAAMLIMPGALGGGNPFSDLSKLIVLGAVIFVAIALILIAVKNIPFFTPYIPTGLGDNIIKLLAWIAVLLIGILTIVINLLSF